ncbi:MAG TPA: tRNA epoxyqueuosine(34) reductase QueG [Longimicrobiales bacterium]
MDIPSENLGERIRREALRLGFDRVGIAPVRESEHAAFYRRWLAAGRHGTMDYLARPDAVERRTDPRAAWPELRSAIVVAMDYHPGDGSPGRGVGREAGGCVGREPVGPEDGGAEAGTGGGRESPGSGRAASAPRESRPPGVGRAAPVSRELRPTDVVAAAPAPAPADPARAIIARYARGRDYHKVMKKRLLALLRFIEAEAGRALPAARAYVDTGPVLERELARRAGLGWFGRNTMLIHPRAGSYFFIGTLLLELDLEPDPPFEADRCGTCSACIDACPTGALLGRDADGAPVIDATRCISYLTIEHHGPIPRELRPLIGNRVFGCDICQEVCPFSRKFSEPTSEPAFAARGRGESPFGVEPDPRLSGTSHPGTASPSLVELMSMDADDWESFSRGSAVRRAGRSGFLRNVAVALGNWGSEEAVPVLSDALSDSDPLVRGHAAWALGEVGSPAAQSALAARLEVEVDDWVREEVELALRR